MSSLRKSVYGKALGTSGVKENEERTKSERRQKKNLGLRNRGFEAESFWKSGGSRGIEKEKGILLYCCGHAFGSSFHVL